MRIFTGEAWQKHLLVTVEGITACANCCATGDLKQMQEEVCRGWTEDTPCRAWLVLHKATEENFHCKTEQGTRRTTEALKTRIDRAKKARLE